MRVLTSGGAAPPANTCTNADINKISKVPYSTDYIFWKPIITSTPPTISFPANTPAIVNSSVAPCTPILQFHAYGTQNYLCNGSVWNFVVPEANLSISNTFVDGKKVSSKKN